jgi:hypothetical protein
MMLFRRSDGDGSPGRRERIMLASWLVPGTGQLMLGMKRRGQLHLALWAVCIVPCWFGVVPPVPGAIATFMAWLAAQVHLWRHLDVGEMGGP